MAHRYDWPMGTGQGVGTCRLCGVTLRYVATGPQGGQKREWWTPNGEIHTEGRSKLQGEPPCVNGAVGPKLASADRAYEALTVEQKHGLAELMWKARDIAIRLPSTKRIMQAQIKHLAFYWTTSAFCPVRGVVVPDAVKFDLRHMRHTAAAHRILVPVEPVEDDDLVHEHAVPRSILSKYVTDEATSVADVVATFNRHCVGVLITKAEDRQLNAGGFRHQMPTSWTWSDDHLARYAAVGLRVFNPMTDAPCACHC